MSSSTKASRSLRAKMEARWSKGTVPVPEYLPRSRWNDAVDVGVGYRTWDSDRSGVEVCRRIGLLSAAMVARVLPVVVNACKRSSVAAYLGLEPAQIYNGLYFAEIRLDRPDRTSGQSTGRVLATHCDDLTAWLRHSRMSSRYAVSLGAILRLLDTARLAFQTSRGIFADNFNDIRRSCSTAVTLGMNLEEEAVQSRLTGLIESIPEWVDNSSRWETETARGIARSMAGEWAWDRGPILADALQDAGCEIDWLLRFLRDPAFVDVAFRGMWFLEWLRGTPFRVSSGTVSCYLTRDHPFEHVAFGRAEYDRNKPVLSDSLRKKGQRIANLLNDYEITVAEAKERLAEIHY